MAQTYDDGDAEHEQNGCDQRDSTDTIHGHL